MKNQIYLIDKADGITSFDVVREVRKTTGIRRVGHAGTLDPFATGLLIVATGSYTRLADYFHRYGKTYLATFRLGVTTDTDDMTGAVLKETAVDGIRETDILGGLERFKGTIVQKPPAISAKQVNGKRLYKMNRNGVKLEAKAVEVVVHDIRNIRVDIPFVTLEVECGTGTYIRSIARDLGEFLGVGAAVKTLCRTGIGPYKLADSCPVEQLSPIPHHLILPEIESFSLDVSSIDALVSGRSLLLRGVFLEDGQLIRVFNDYFETLCALCRVTLNGSAGSRIQPEKVFRI
ncbi:MAG: tRNA pseudouridine(55) synthase TruB [Acidobacteria bacterium]|nr:tRNA pseudouridine(55) synthase TruB [Acidobacteriota bacterium]